LRIGYEYFRAVDYVLAAFFHSGGVAAGGVGAGAGLCDRETADPVARCYFRKIFFLLFVRAQLPDRYSAQDGMRLEGQARAAVAASVS